MATNPLPMPAGTNPAPVAGTNPAPVESLPTVTVSAPAPAAPAQGNLSAVLQPPEAGRPLTPCDFGFCGDVAQVGTAGETPRYMSDGGQSVLWGAGPGGTSRLGQMLVAERFTPGRLSQFVRGQDTATLQGARNNPVWGETYRSLLEQTGDPEAAMAITDAEVGLDNPGLTGAFAEQLAQPSAEALNRARDRAQAAAAFTGDAGLAAQPYVPGTFQPGLAVTGGEGDQATYAFGGAPAGTTSAGADRAGLAEMTAAQQGTSSLFDFANEQRKATLDQQRALLQANLDRQQEARLAEQLDIRRQAEERLQAAAEADNASTGAALQQAGGVLMMP